MAVTLTDLFLKCHAIRTGDLDLGIVGTDMYLELTDSDPNVIVLHDALNFGQCKLALGVPMAGRFASINSLEQLRDMPEWTAETPLRVVTGYHNIATRFFKEKGFKHVVMLSADGALEAAPAMGSADIILDLVSLFIPSIISIVSHVSLLCYYVNM